MNRTHCEGWWEQDGFGRQPMEQLQISFAGGKLTGSGIDIVGPFRLDGICDRNGVTIFKRYIGRHQIQYVGTTDGEGTFHGNWLCNGVIGGKWLIRIQDSKSRDHAVRDITEQFVAESLRDSPAKD